MSGRISFRHISTPIRSSIWMRRTGCWRLKWPLGARHGAAAGVGAVSRSRGKERDMASLGSFGLDVGIYGALANPETILQLARHAEEAGFESIWLADHVAFPVSIKSKYPYSAT